MNIWPWSRIRALEDLTAEQGGKIRRLEGEADERRRIASERLASNIRLQSQLDAKSTRLERIAALETPKCASIGKRMAKIARGEG